MPNQTKAGVIYALVAFTFWGLTPIYFKALAHVPATEILLHRVLWSVVFLFLILALRRQFQTVKILWENKPLLLKLFLSALLVGGNWLIFIWAVNHDMLIESSLGYYINPLVNILLGILFLQERPTKMQKVAIVLAFLSVSYQVYTLGKLPVVSLSLAFSFGFYGLLRKQVSVSSLPGLYIETLLLLPVALFYLLYLFFEGTSSFSPTLGTMTSWILLLAGPVTIFPLLCFNSATTRLQLSTIGYFQYIGPSVNLLLALWVYQEPISQEKLITFALIWSALILVSLESFQNRRTLRTMHKEI